MPSSSKRSSSANEKLDVPDTSREQRIGNLLQNLARESESMRAASSRGGLDALGAGHGMGAKAAPRSLEELRAQAAQMGPPPSSVLSRVQSFLPQMQEANEALRRRMEVEGKEAVEIELKEGDAEEEDDDGEESEEAVDGREEKAYISMDLGLGVFEERRKQTETSSSSSSSDDSSEGDDNDSDSVSDSSGEGGNGEDKMEVDLPGGERNRRRTGIEEIG